MIQQKYLGCCGNSDWMDIPVTDWKHSHSIESLRRLFRGAGVRFRMKGGRQ